MYCSESKTFYVLIKHSNCRVYFLFLFMKLKRRQTMANSKQQTCTRMSATATGIETPTTSVLGVPSIGT